MPSVRLQRWLEARLLDERRGALDGIECFLLARVQDVLHGRLTT